MEEVEVLDGFLPYARICFTMLFISVQTHSEVDTAFSAFGLGFCKSWATSQAADAVVNLESTTLNPKP